MSSNYVIPTEKSVASLLAMIFGDGLGVNDGDAADLNSQHVATFIDDEDKLVAICACDKEFVAYSGAALSMIPADVANEMISGNSISEALVGNFYEVMNICSKLLMSDSSAHLRLDKTLDPGAANDAVASLEAAAEKVAFSVNIPSYGSGTLTFLIS